jgi:antitoxin ChpS
MHTTHLRKVGGSVMLVVPTAFLEQLNLEAGAKVSVIIENGHLVITPKPKQGYKLAELLSMSDNEQAPIATDAQWVDGPSIGRELI